MEESQHRSLGSVIECRDLSKSYDGKKEVLSKLSFSIGEGECVALVGANGAGKSTLIKILLNLVRPSAGKVQVFSKEPSEVTEQDGVGYLPELAGYWGELSAVEMLSFLGKVRGLSPAVSSSRAEKLLRILGLQLRSSRLMGGYSKGMLQRSGIAASLLMDPQLWILDEPMGGLDPRAQEKFRELILKLKGEGKTLLISSHSLEDIRLLCDRVLVLEKSKLVIDGPSSEVLDQLKEKYRSSEPWDEDPLGEIGEDFRL